MRSEATLGKKCIIILTLICMQSSQVLAAGTAAISAFEAGKAFGQGKNTSGYVSGKILSPNATNMPGNAGAPPAFIAADPRVRPQQGTTGLTDPSNERKHVCDALIQGGHAFTDRKDAEECSAVQYLSNNPGYAKRLTVQSGIDTNAPFMYNANTVSKSPEFSGGGAFLSGGGTTGSCSTIKKTYPASWATDTCDEFITTQENLCTVPRRVNVNWYSHHSCSVDRHYGPNPNPPVCREEDQPGCEPDPLNPESCKIQLCDPLPMVYTGTDDECSGKFWGCSQTGYSSWSECIDYNEYGQCEEWDHQAYEVFTYSCDDEDYRPSGTTYLGFSYTLTEEWDESACDPFRNYNGGLTACSPSEQFCKSGFGPPNEPPITKPITTYYCPDGVCVGSGDPAHYSSFAVSMNDVTKECWGDSANDDGWVFTDRIGERYIFDCLMGGLGPNGCSKYRWRYNYPDYDDPLPPTWVNNNVYQSPICPEVGGPTECYTYKRAEVEYLGQAPTLTDNAKCVDRDPGYTQPRIFKNGSGSREVSVLHQCWAWSHQYSCTANNTSECDDLKSRCLSQTCTEVDKQGNCLTMGVGGYSSGSQCVEYLMPGVCSRWEHNYQCMASPAVTETVEDCSAQLFCQNGTCYGESDPPDEDFGRSVAAMEGARQAGVYIDPNEFRLFTGDGSKCTKKLGGLVDCCKSGGSAVGSTGMSNDFLVNQVINNSVDYAWSLGSPYVYDALFASDIPWLMNKSIDVWSNWGSFSAPFTPSISFYGLTFTTGAAPTSMIGSYSSIGSAGSVNVYFNPTMFYLSIAVMILTELLTCDQESQITEMRRKEDLCEYVGQYCSKKTVFGICLSKKQSYCCFNSRLAKIIQTYGRQQLGKGFGSAKNPDCGGFTLAEFQSINFSTNEFSNMLAEFYKEVVPNQMDAASLVQGVSTTINTMQP